MPPLVSAPPLCSSRNLGGEGLEASTEKTSKEFVLFSSTSGSDDVSGTAHDAGGGSDERWAISGGGASGSGEKATEDHLLLGGHLFHLLLRNLNNSGKFRICLLYTSDAYDD